MKLEYLKTVPYNQTLVSSFKDTQMPSRSGFKLRLKEKTIQLENGLAEISSDHLCSGLVPTPIAKGFRNRAKYKIFGTPDRFQIKGTDPIQGEVPYDKALWLLPGWGRNLVMQIAEIISEKLSDFWVDGFEVQLSHGNRQAHVTLSVKRQETQSYAGLADFLLCKNPALEGVSVPSQREDFGKSYLLHHIGGVDFYSHYSAFFQSNICLTAKLMEDVKNKCQHKDFFRIWDLYCGIGLFSLSLADKTTTAIGVDINKRAVDSARFNAKNLQFRDVSFVCSPVENFLRNSPIGFDDLIIIDPPRSGCPESLVQIISRHMPHYICSISCNLTTHIRDLKNWMRNGYAVQSIAAFDMFPFTEYLETAAFLQRND